MFPVHALWQVVGSSIVSEFKTKDVVRMPKIDFIDDKAGKPVGIYEHIGIRPILAFGADNVSDKHSFTTP